MVEAKIWESIDGFCCIMDYQNKHILNVLQFSPFDGREMPGGFLYELSVQVSNYLIENGSNKEIDEWCNHLKDNTPKFDIENVPDNLKHLIVNKNWYEELKLNQREKHRYGEFCGEMSGCFIADCYEYQYLPRLACVPIQYCPFCGAKLPSEFDQEDWWEKEFKTFKWYKDHKLGEWADDYVDDHDWYYDEEGNVVMLNNDEEGNECKQSHKKD